LDNRNNALDFWQTATKTTRVKSAGTQLPPLGNIRLAILESGQKEVLGSFWAEGISASSFSQLLTAQHKSKSALNGSDSTYVSVISFGLQPYTPQTKYIAPMPIPETNWKANGVGIRRNGDYDCSNILSSNISDWGRSSANDNEDDLIRLDINITPCTGITYGLVSTSSTTDIKFWSSEKKGYGDAIIPNENSGMMKLLTNSTTFYAESSPYNTSSASYKLLAIDKNNKILFSEEITFRPFNSITIAFVGEFEQAGDPGVSPGINNWGINQLLNGYDVYVWDDGHDVFNSNTDCNKWGEGRSFDEVCNAINNRGVSNIAIIGYSHGGGSVYNLAWRMFYDGKTSDSNLYWYPPKKIQNSYNLVFTSYIDAVPNNSWIHGLLGTSVTVRPKGSNYHLNQFQENSIPNGCSIFTSNNEKNWTSVGLKHSNSDFLVSIDTNPEVQALLTQKFNEKITR
jgi:hypothetical protein